MWRRGFLGTVLASVLGTLLPSRSACNKEALPIWKTDGLHIFSPYSNVVDRVTVITLDNINAICEWEEATLSDDGRWVPKPGGQRGRALLIIPDRVRQDTGGRSPCVLKDQLHFKGGILISTTAEGA